MAREDESTRIPDAVLSGKDLPDQLLLAAAVAHLKGTDAGLGGWGRVCGHNPMKDDLSNFYSASAEPFRQSEGVSGWNWRGHGPTALRAASQFWNLLVQQLPNPLVQEYM